MKEFNGFFEFAAHLIASDIAVIESLNRGLKIFAASVEKTAKDEIGFYQDAVGPFPAWAELAESTETEKARLGYPLEAPLLRTGDMKDSISHEVGMLEAVVGSTDDKMVYHEFGTSRMPPRPVLGPALYHNRAKIEKILGAAVVTGLIGQDIIHEALGYNLVTSGERITDSLGR